MPRKVGMSKALAAAYGKKKVSTVELARREWCKRNFLIAGLIKNVELIADELKVPSGNFTIELNQLRDANNRDGRAKGLNIS